MVIIRKEAENVCIYTFLNLLLTPFIFGGYLVIMTVLNVISRDGYFSGDVVIVIAIVFCAYFILRMAYCRLAKNFGPTYDELSSLTKFRENLSFYRANT